MVPAARMSYALGFHVLWMSVMHCKLKGIVSRDGGQYIGFKVIDLKNSRLPEHIFSDFRVSSHDLLLKNQSAAVSH